MSNGTDEGSGGKGGGKDKGPPRRPPPPPRVTAKHDGGVYSSWNDEDEYIVSDPVRSLGGGTGSSASPWTYRPGESLTSLTPEAMCQGPCLTDEDVYGEVDRIVARDRNVASKQQPVASKQPVAPLWFDVDALHDETLLGEIDKVATRLESREQLTYSGTKEDEEYLTALLAAFDRKGVVGPFPLVIYEAREVLQSMQRSREARDEVLGFVDQIAPDDDVTAMRAAQQLLEESPGPSESRRQALLTAAFGMMSSDTATSVHETLTNSKLKHGRRIRARFARLPASTRKELLGILSRQISAVPRPERPGIMGTGGHGGLPYYVVIDGTTIDEVARYLSDDPSLALHLARLNGVRRDQRLEGGTRVHVPVGSATSVAAKRDLDADQARGRVIGGGASAEGERTRVDLSKLGFEWQGGVSIPLTASELRAFRQTGAWDPRFSQGYQKFTRGDIKRDRKLAQRVPNPILSLFFPTSRLYFKDPRLQIQHPWYRQQSETTLQGFDAGTNLGRVSGAVGVGVNLLPLAALEFGPLLLEGGAALGPLLAEELVLLRMAAQAVPQALQGLASTGAVAYYANPLLFNELGLIGAGAYLGAEGDLAALFSDPFVWLESLIAYGTHGKAPSTPRARTRTPSAPNVEPEPGQGPGTSGRRATAQTVEAVKTEPVTSKLVKTKPVQTKQVKTETTPEFPANEFPANDARWKQWPPPAPAGEKPAWNEPGGARYRYDRYRYEKWVKSGKPDKPPPDLKDPKTYFKRHVAPKAVGQSPGEMGSPAHKELVLEVRDLNIIGTERVGARRPDGVGDPNQPLKIPHGPTITPEKGGRVLYEADNFFKDGSQIDSGGRAQVRDLRAADPTATIVVQDVRNPKNIIVYGPGTQPPPPGRLKPGTPNKVTVE